MKMRILKNNNLKLYSVVHDCLILLIPFLLKDSTRNHSKLKRPLLLMSSPMYLICLLSSTVVDVLSATIVYGIYFNGKPLFKGSDDLCSLLPELGVCGLHANSECIG